MWLMYGVGVVVAELMHDFGDAVMVAFGEGGSDGGFKAVRILSQFCFTHPDGTRIQASLSCTQYTSFAPIPGAASTYLLL